ncbi:helix-turn-helix domain-containing protein [Streptomyces tailanensis]|uniref:helix-turn-helix domain-containing protein n=1 Tax=Streptomyces tailanensis TaxID=2569858 RepID=UPI00122DC7EE|nr:helix-turn-helix domain-containing protein [Streptomyces tailanensis]
MTLESVELEAAMTVLQLLAEGAPVSSFQQLAEAWGGASDGDAVYPLQPIAEIGLRISAQIERHLHREADCAALLRTARELNALCELDPLLKLITSETQRLLNVDLAFISLIDAESGGLCVRSVQGQASKISVGMSTADLPNLDGLDHELSAESLPFWTHDYLSDQRVSRNATADAVVQAEGLRAITAVSLSHQAESLGVLHLASRSVRHFTVDEISLLGSLGEVAGMAIGRVMDLQRMKTAVTDLKNYSLQTETELRSATRLIETHHRLIELALRGGNLMVLATYASAIFGGAVLISDADGRPLACCGELPPSAGERQAFVNTMTATQLTPVPFPVGNGMWATTIVADSTQLGSVLLHQDHPITRPDVVVLKLLSQAVAIQFMVQNQSAVAERDHEVFLDALLSVPRQPLKHLDREASQFRLDLYKPHVIVLVRPECESWNKLAQWASEYAHRTGGLSSSRHDSVVLLLPGEEPGATAQKVHDELSSLLSKPPTVSAAGPTIGPGSVGRIYHEAKRYMKAMISLGATGCSASVQELSLLSMLLSDDRDPDEFINKWIGSLIEHDRIRFTELTRTLEIYFEVGCSPTYAAKKLHVHPNTVVRRLQRISEILGPAWQSHERALAIQLALRLSHLRSTLLERKSAHDVAGPPDLPVWTP